MLRHWNRLTREVVKLSSPKYFKNKWMWYLGTWFGAEDVGVGLTVGDDDIKGLL